MPRILARPALFVLIAFGVLLAPQFAERAHTTHPISITVDSTSDSLAPGNTTLGLREAVMLATGDLGLGDLSSDECDNVSSTFFSLGTCASTVPSESPGPDSADTIVFDQLIFPANSETKILLLTPLRLDTGGDTIDGAGVGVLLTAVSKTQDCIVISSDNNTVKGLRIRQCGAGVFVSGGLAGTDDSANNNVIGGTTEDERNVFTLTVGAVVLNGNAHNNRVIGNHIGTNIDGSAGIANDIGVAVTNGAHDNIIGGTTAAERNVISGNTVDGVRVGGANRTVIQGNYIGTNAAGDAAIPNGKGVSIKDSEGNTVGGDNAGERNLISGNFIGVELLAGADGNMIQGNYIGTNAAGTAAIPNTNGVTISEGASGNTIGGESPGERNVISGNDRHGVGFYGLDTAGNTVVGNYIGTTASGEQPLGNPGYGGIEIADAGGNLIKGNVISANGTVGGDADGGIVMFDSSGFEIYENLIGVSASGAPLGNASYGIYMRNSSDNIVGDEAGGGNVVAHSTGAGVHVEGAGVGETLRNTIRGNSIYSNGGKGIRNADGGNGELPPPVITGFGSVSGTACADCTIDVYSDDEDEGAVYEGATTADGNGDWTLPSNPAGPNVTATATDAAGNTSEFSDEVAAPEPTPIIVTWGDNNCSGSADPVDSLLTLRYGAGLSANTGSCPEMGMVVEVVGASPHLWGDVDCGGDVNSVDSLKLLRFDAGLTVSQEADCPEVGASVTIDVS